MSQSPGAGRPKQDEPAGEGPPDAPKPAATARSKSATANPEAGKPQKLRVPFDCPKCKEQGSISVEKLDRAMKCNNCDVVFHITPRFEVLLGVPKVRVARGTAQGGSKAAKPSNAATIIAVVLTVSVLIGMAGWLWSALAPTPLPPLPTTFAARIKLLLDSSLNDDRRTLRQLTDPSVAGDLKDWQESAKDALKGVKRSGELEQKILSESRLDKLATAFAAKPGARSGLFLFWRLQPDGTWLFDPKKSLAGPSG